MRFRVIARSVTGPGPVRRTALAGFVAGALAAGVGTAVAGDSAPTTIRPGIGAAGAELGMSVDDVRSRLGAPLTENTAPDGAVAMMSYTADQIVDLYFDPQSHLLRQVIVAAKDHCTKAGECLYREGDLSKLKNRYGSGLVRFEDWDGSVTYRRLITYNGKKVMTEWVPSEERDAVVQVSVLYWDGSITDSGLGDG